MLSISLCITKGGWGEIIQCGILIFLSANISKVSARTKRDALNFVQPKGKAHTAKSRNTQKYFQIAKG